MEVIVPLCLSKMAPAKMIASAMLMMLCFLFDQAQQLSCRVFQAALAKSHGKKICLWEAIRGAFISGIEFNSWTQFMEFISGTGGWKLVRNTS